MPRYSSVYCIQHLVTFGFSVLYKCSYLLTYLLTYLWPTYTGREVPLRSISVYCACPAAEQLRIHVVLSLKLFGLILSRLLVNKFPF